MPSQYTKKSQLNDSIELMVSILVRYPEINTIKTDPKAKEITFSFLVREELSQEKFKTLKEKLNNNLEALLFLENKESGTLRFNLESHAECSYVEISRDFGSVGQRELSLLTQLIKDEFGDKLLIESNPKRKNKELKAQEEVIENLMEGLIEHRDDLIGYREAGKVKVFQKSGV